MPPGQQQGNAARRAHSDKVPRAFRFENVRGHAAYRREGLRELRLMHKSERTHEVRVCARVPRSLWSSLGDLASEKLDCGVVHVRVVRMYE